MKDHIGALVIIVILGGFLYLNALRVPFQWDDTVHIVQNPALSDWKDLSHIYRFWPTRCFLFWTLALNYRAGGLNVFGYHLVNNAFHFCSSFLVYLIFLSLPGEGGRYSPSEVLKTRRLALFSGLIFLAHPIQTQAVTYIIQRGASLSGLFCLLSLFLYSRARSKKCSFCYPAAWIAGLLGMYSKEGSAILPLLLLLWEALFGPREKWVKKLKVWLPFALLPALLLLTMWWTVRTGDSGFYYALNLQKRLPALGRVDSTVPVTSRLIYCLTQLNVVRTYIRLFFLPVHQTVYYDFPLSVSFFQTATVLSAALLSTFLLLAGREAGSARIISFGILFFFIALLPTSSLLVLLPLISEHHLYLALAGFAWAFSSALGKICERRSLRAMTASGAAVVFCFSLLTCSRNLVWVTPFSLWADALRQAPHLASLHDYLASVYIGQERYEEAIEECRRALEIDPAYDAYHNLWAAYHNLKRYDQAEEAIRTRMKKFPDQLQVHQALGLTLLATGRQGEAKKELLSAIRLQPELARPHFLLGKLYLAEKEYARAESEFRQAIELAPYFQAAYLGLGSAYEATGKYRSAAEIYRKAPMRGADSIKLRVRLIKVYLKLDQEQSARRELEKIESLIKNPELLNALKKHFNEVRQPEL